ncbi:type II toxin-antitoxin system RelE/ParE family toxin [Lichenicoccus sp.]|uniref:type II toxin-antitoxin system RelE/ParE family toxin n=1 Tax=Lichenicoccus sp. TaxID=2781899 RepID=UPI003D115909
MRRCWSLKSAALSRTLRPPERPGASREGVLRKTPLDPAGAPDPHSDKQRIPKATIREEAGAFRAIYLATLGDTVVVLHAFQKKTQQTAQRDIELAASRLKSWKG